MKLKIHDIWSDYELIDSGNEKKLERFGEVILIRPESSARHKPEMSISEWNELAHAEFIQSSRTSGQWKKIKEHPDHWNLRLTEKLHKLNLNLKKTGFKHVGIFPEQILNWLFIAEQGKAKGGDMLNLFGYTGISSLVGSASGYSVCHVDALKQLVQWGKEMMLENSLENIRWICDDAPGFVKREIRRENLYDLILADPPAFGYGKAKRPWKIEKDLLPFVSDCKEILKPEGILSLSLYTEKVDLNHIIDDIVYMGYTLLEDIDIDGFDRFGKNIDHGHIIRFTVK